MWMGQSPSLGLHWPFSSLGEAPQSEILSLRVSPHPTPVFLPRAWAVAVPWRLGGRVPLLPDRAVYLINLVIRVDTQESLGPESSAALGPVLQGLKVDGGPSLLAPCPLPGVGCGCPRVREPQ